jgi:hypothetical protein
VKISKNCYIVTKRDKNGRQEIAEDPKNSRKIQKLKQMNRPIQEGIEIFYDDCGEVDEWGRKSKSLGMTTPKFWSQLGGLGMGFHGRGELEAIGQGVGGRRYRTWDRFSRRET